MKSIKNYITNIFTAIYSLLSGMSVTMREFFTKKVTEQYPENRKTTLNVFDRVRGELVMPHDENNEHACTGCGICQMNCPNGTIKVITKMVEVEEGAKPKKALDLYCYDLGKCSFCNLCVISCPSKAIKFQNTFENSVFNREKLFETLNKEGSKVREKIKE